MQRNEKILKKHMSENQSLKKERKMPEVAVERLSEPAAPKRDFK